MFFRALFMFSSVAAYSIPPQINDIETTTLDPLRSRNYVLDIEKKFNNETNDQYYYAAYQTAQTRQEKVGEGFKYRFIAHMIKTTCLKSEIKIEDLKSFTQKMLDTAYFPSEFKIIKVDFLVDGEKYEINIEITN